MTDTTNKELEARVRKLEADLAQEKKDCITALRERDRYGSKWREFEIECNGLRSDLKKAREALKTAEHFFHSPTSFSVEELNAVANAVSRGIDPTDTRQWQYRSYLVWAVEQPEPSLTAAESIALHNEDVSNNGC